MTTNVKRQRCGTCRWLSVPLNKGGKRVPMKWMTYMCDVPIPVPPMPDSVRFNLTKAAPDPNAFENRRRCMTSDEGRFCRMWELHPDITIRAWDGSHWVGKRVRLWLLGDPSRWSEAVWNVVAQARQDGVVEVSNPVTGSRMLVRISMLEVVP